MRKRTYDDRNPIMGQLNIAMIGHKRIPSREGGIEIVVEELGSRLVQRGQKVTVYNRRGHHVSGRNFDNSSNVQNKGYYRGIKIRTVPTIERRGLAAVTSSFFATMKAVWQCRNKRKRYDCIHYHAEGPSVMLIVPHLFHIRTVVTIHGLDWARVKWGGIAVWYLKLGEKIAVRYADEIIVLSRNIQMYFKDAYNRETNFLSNGISGPTIRRAHLIQEKWNLMKDDYILFLGRIVPEKGLRYLVEAFKKVNTDKKLVVAGGSSDTAGFFNAIKEDAKADNRIMFTGFVHGEVLDELYSNAYLYVLPSDLEGMPLSLLEAMSYGNCCLVSSIAECIEVVEDKALVFQKSDVCDLAEKLQDCCHNVEKVWGFKKNSREFILKKYDWDRVVEMTLQFYRGGIE